MTEYEAAVLAVQQASLAAQHGATLAAYIVGGAQCLLIAWGIWIMRGANKSREPLIEALQEQTAALRDLRLASQQQNEGMQTLLERTAK